MTFKEAYELAYAYSMDQYQSATHALLNVEKADEASKVPFPTISQVLKLAGKIMTEATKFQTV